MSHTKNDSDQLDIEKHVVFSGSLNDESEARSRSTKKEAYHPMRSGRACTLNIHPTKNNLFSKVIIPYNFEKKQYWINQKELQFYENRKYLLDKLAYFCSKPVFYIENPYEPNASQKILLFLPIIALFFIALYMSVVLVTIFSFNPVVIYTLYSWTLKGYNSIQLFKFILMEKFKIKAMNKLLKEENESQECIDNKLKWMLGQSGYWIEIQKLVE